MECRILSMVCSELGNVKNGVDFRGWWKEQLVSYRSNTVADRKGSKVVFAELGRHPFLDRVLPVGLEPE